jgi:ATP-dependent DNA helicase RecQ
VPALVVTATASPATQKKLIVDLGLKRPCLIVAHPDRGNIMYFKKERSPSGLQQDDLDEILYDIATKLRACKLEYPITILYCEYEVMAYVFRYMEAALGGDQYVGNACPENRIFAMYHQAYTDTMKCHIICELGKGNISKVRFVVATIALGMGLDAPSIRKVIHFKSPTSIEKYLQETGRAGRDGQPAEVILYYNRTDLRGNRPGQQQAMVDYCKMTDGCFRDKLLQYLQFEAPKGRILC